LNLLNYFCFFQNFFFHFFFFFFKLRVLIAPGHIQTCGNVVPADGRNRRSSSRFVLAEGTEHTNAKSASTDRLPTPGQGVDRVPWPTWPESIEPLIIFGAD
jgi:hypothetical protein